MSMEYPGWCISNASQGYSSGNHDKIVEWKNYPNFVYI